MLLQRHCPAWTNVVIAFQVVVKLFCLPKAIADWLID